MLSLNRQQDYDGELRRVRQALLRRLWLRDWLRGAAVWLIIWGAGALTMRLLGKEGLWLWWGGAGLVVRGALSGIRAYRRGPNREALKAVLDSRSRGGGLYMASALDESGGWSMRLPKPVRLKVCWQGNRWWIWGVMSVVFLWGCFELPLRYFNASAFGSRPLDITAEVAMLSEHIETLTEENILAEQESQALTQELAELGQKAQGDDPGRVWEALDAMHQRLQNEVSRAAQKQLELTQASTQAETMAQALAERSGELTAGQQNEALEALAKELEEMLKSQPELQELLDKEFLQQLREGKCNGQNCGKQLQALARAMKMNKEALQACMGRLCQASLLDPKMLSECKRLGEGNAEALMAFLKKGGDCQGAMKSCVGSCPGRGGVSRGRGDAAMCWKEPTDEEGAAFKEQVLPSTMQGGLEETKLLGVSSGVPQAAGDEVKIGQGGLVGRQAGSSQAAGQTLLPKHKRVLEKYFSNK